MDKSAKDKTRKEKTRAGKMRAIIYKVEDAALVSLLLLMIVLAVAQILMRNFFDSGLPWADVLVRILVLWVGLFGAMVASRNGDHIYIDVLTRYVPQRGKDFLSSIAEIFTSGICFVTAFYSLKFLQMEYVDGGTAFAEVPSWICEAVIPFVFFVIGIRYVILSATSFREFIKPSS